MTSVGFKPTTFRTGICRSIQLSYEASLKKRCKETYSFSNKQEFAGKLSAKNKFGGDVDRKVISFDAFGCCLFHYRELGKLEQEGLVAHRVESYHNAGISIPA